ncbi:CDP-alcohol phosphatidyltransferase family protein [Candidatus Poribacteria bacterium]|nr:CDP-alcohol phosphatidyltransferase family protein [Candidatus Poribacteria bacterium]MYK22126.1 CDP-alcohol phosphatidyltransferase family protein [Candidatus Poribacteria bacterium]
MLANTITLTRLLLTFVVIALFGHQHSLSIALIFTIALIFALDGVDGYIARKRSETSQLGEILDTLADRIIENTFWIYFTAKGQIPVWMPIVVMARGFISDALQRTHGYPTHGWTHALTRSRMSRAISGITKMLAFTSLASAKVFKNPLLEEASLILATLAVGFCLLRGLPFFFLRKTPCPPIT